MTAATRPPAGNPADYADPEFGDPAYLEARRIYAAALQDMWRGLGRLAERAS